MKNKEIDLYINLFDIIEDTERMNPLIKKQVTDFAKQLNELMELPQFALDNAEIKAKTAQLCMYALGVRVGAAAAKRNK